MTGVRLRSEVSSYFSKETVSELKLTPYEQSKW
jgi:hypothetical protein